MRRIVLSLRKPALLMFLIVVVGLAATTSAVQSGERVEYIVLSWNDLGMHCMNKDHAVLSILPPYNTLYAQVIRRGDESTPPELVTEGVTVEYSIPGNTYSAGKTDFWDYVLEIFGLELPPDVGLTGLGLTGEFELVGDRFVAEGIPVTPFTDAQPTGEDPYQQALVIVRDSEGVELARSEPVIPVSTEVNCLACHDSELDIVFEHPNEGGYDPNAQPIFCAGCHSSPALGTPFDPEAHYLSFRIHDRHDFLDETIPGIEGCNMCHPGPNTQCLRGTMGNDFGMICQDCHGTMNTMHVSIENGRTPWLDEPACRECHTATYGEPEGQLFRLSAGHGGVMCAGCHGSPHAIFPSREDRDNANHVELQGHAGTLDDCTVCHGVPPSAPGPHGFDPGTGVVWIEPGTMELVAFPNPLRPGPDASCGFEARPGTAGTSGSAGSVLVFDARGRTVRLLRPSLADDGAVRVVWDGRDARGREVASGVYFVRWSDGGSTASGKVIVMK
jgi:hypothetical protein